MKKLNILLILSFFAFAFVACEKDQDMYKVLPVDKVIPPVLASHGAIVIDADNLSSNTTFKWQHADFGTPAAVEYSLYVNTDNGEPQLVSSSYGDSINVKLEDLNKALLQAGADEGATVDAIFTLKAAISTAYASVTSNPVIVSVTTVAPLYPSQLYMIGQDFGGWDWNSATVAEMIPIHSHPGQFWCVRYFTTNGFKWNTVKAWGGDFYSLGTDVGFTTHDGNAFVASDGFYIVLVDYLANTITVEPANVYGMGDCFGGWNTGQYPFTANNANKTMNITTASGGEVRMYASSSATDADWWQMEFIIINGEIVYRGTGNDQDRVTVAAGKTVTLDFNNGTGTIQ
ncbi:MAG: SusF/SusE family outer membrane protein [Prevotellaceae bacterium]|jgi:hypothetical protein|nr:SusF/SusE family outer membrane protein [Prevotellaceae bacterium]